MALSEIEKLERRYAENPSGLTFAPLAEVHRKNGDVARALELLRPGLELHPDYIPASIVLGRCHLDQGDLPAAEAAFTHVLALDGENVIALKALADIGERQHHFDQAERWLRTLLSVDRSNDDAQAQLERIERARRDAAAAPQPPLESAAAATAAPEPGPAAVTPIEPASPEPEPIAAAAAEPPAADSPPIEPAPAWISAPEAPETDAATPLPLEDLEPSLTVTDRSDPPPEGLEVEEPAALAEPVEPLADMVGRDVETSGGEDGFRVEQSEDIVLRSSGGHEFQVPDASLELSDRVPVAPPSPFEPERAPGFASLEEPAAAPSDMAPVEIGSEPSPMSLAEPGGPGAADLELVEPDSGSREEVEAEPVHVSAEPDAEPDAEPARGPEPLTPAHAFVAPEPEPVVEPWVTPEAAVVTRPDPEPVAAPAATTPPEIVSTPEPEPVVTETMAEVLLQQGHAMDALRVYRELEARHPGDPRLREKVERLEALTRPAEPLAARRAYLASETGGQSVGEFLRRMLAARPPAVAAAPMAARQATPPAESTGAPTRPAADALSLSSVFGEETTPLPPAVPAAGSAGGGVSFDEFYGAPGQSAAPKGRGPDPKNDDLDQFHTWLQNLKR